MAVNINEISVIWLKNEKQKKKNTCEQQVVTCFTIFVPFQLDAARISVNRTHSFVHMRRGVDEVGIPNCKQTQLGMS